MKIINGLFVVMFLVFAALQLNDPDPYLWIPIYTAMVVICAMAFFNNFPRKAMMVLLACYLLFSLYYIPGVSEWLRQDDKAQLFDNIAKMEHPFIEESREFLGLMINASVLIYYLIISRKK